MIKTEKLTKVFRTEDVETFCLRWCRYSKIKVNLWPSWVPGFGKTTLLNIVGLLDNATSGTYDFNGTDVSNLTGENAPIIEEEILVLFFKVSI